MPRMSPFRLLRKSKTLDSSQAPAKCPRPDLQCYLEVQELGESCVLSSAVSPQHRSLFRAPRVSAEEVLVVEGCFG